MLRPSGVRRSVGCLHSTPESRMRLKCPPSHGSMDWAKAVPAAVVERAELSGHAQGRALCNVDALQQSGGGKDERQVALPGQTLHTQRKAVEALAVILMRKGGSRAGCAPKLHIVLTFFHSVHLKVCCWCSL